MASLAATTGLGCRASSSTRVVVVPPIQQHRRTSCCSAAKQRNHSVLCVSSGQQRNGAPVVISSSIPKQHTQSDDDNNNMLSGSTRTVTTLFGMALLCVKAFAKVLPPPNLCLSTVSVSTGSLFFAAIRTRRGYLNTPMTVVAAGLKKWLDIYSGVLMVRVLLSWFPNIPWERQPLSAIRDLCDPYLSLFRNIIPPVFDTLDVSPLLAFAVLGSLAKLLSATTI